MNELSIVLNNQDKKYLYEQIYEYIKSEIKDGKLLVGERLPSTRSLAGYLQISRSTVELAYEQLMAEGYLESRPYKGFFVCKVEELYHIEVTETKKTKSQVIVPKKYEFEFSPNAVDLENFPYATWKRITKNTLNEDRGGLFSLGSAQGETELRSTIARYLYSSRGVSCDREQIIVGAGNDYLLMLLNKILGENRNIAMENPTYPKAYRMFSSFGYKLTRIDMDESGMRVDCLSGSSADVAYVMPSHQFPTGIVMPIGRRTQLLKWAEAKENRYIIEDDYDSEFRYKGKPIPALKASDSYEKVIYIGTFSKAIAPAIRISYMVLPLPLLQQYQEKCAYLSSTVSRIDQSILNEFIKNGYFERHLNKMRKIYREKHDLMLLRLKRFEKSFHIMGDYSGLHFLIECRDGRSEKELIEEAEKAKVKVYGMSAYDVFGQGIGKAALLLGFADLTKDEIVKGLDLLEKVWLSTS